MKLRTVLILGAILLLGMAAWAQEFPRAEVGANYSYQRYAPTVRYAKGHSLNGGGGSVVINWNEYLGIRADLQGYTSNTTGFDIPANPTFPNGLQGNVQGNMFTYLFGPQLKVRAHKVQPFGSLLFGGAHTNLYSNVFTKLCQPIAGGCAVSKAPTAEAFALSVGGGIDIPFGKTVSFRPAEANYVMTRFSNPFTGTNNQNHFRYSAGVYFNLGHTTY
jgi:Outer membrane protein beta-barrel domain